MINTLNEEENLPLALRSVVSWADEIVVVDMASDDRTVEIAREFGARVYPHERCDFVEPARAYAFAQATGDWVLVLDADEIVPAELAERLRAIARADAADAVRIPRLNYLLGVPLGYTAWGPKQDRHTRFFKRGTVRGNDRIHGRLRSSPDARVLDLPYQPGHAVHHFCYRDVTHFVAKLNRYTSVEALQAHDRGQRASAVRAVLHATKEFVSRYVKNGGYRDGWRGFYLSGLMAFYRFATYAKLQELESSLPAEAVREEYRREAERLLSGYPDGYRASESRSPGRLSAL
ncbi:MAG TPA: glycosyltransferase family 2 protein [Longimicrobiaceae bacterium]|nr:glycosyltransferase family 2 protein [Longimicrobiaceae bacterium]